MNDKRLPIYSDLKNVIPRNFTSNLNSVHISLKWHDFPNRRKSALQSLLLDKKSSPVLHQWHYKMYKVLKLPQFNGNHDF